MPKFYIHGTPAGEHLRAEIRNDGVHLISAEYRGSKVGLTELRDRYFCAVPFDVWVRIAEAVKGRPLPPMTKKGA